MENSQLFVPRHCSVKRSIQEDEKGKSYPDDDDATISLNDDAQLFCKMIYQHWFAFFLMYCSHRVCLCTKKLYIVG